MCQASAHLYKTKTTILRKHDLNSANKLRKQQKRTFPHISFESFCNVASIFLFVGYYVLGSWDVRMFWPKSSQFGPPSSQHFGPLDLPPGSRESWSTFGHAPKTLRRSPRALQLHDMFFEERKHVMFWSAWRCVQSLGIILGPLHLCRHPHFECL